MTEQPRTSIGTVAEEAARLMEGVASMARSRSSRSQDNAPYSGQPAQEPVSPAAPPGGRRAEDPAEAHAPGDTPAAGACSHCGGERASTFEPCKLCPLCQGIALLRSVRPETMDQLADLASAVTECLRDVAAQLRASASSSTGRPDTGSPAESGRATQDIPVDDESEG
jgi:hypothetical protein